MRRHTGCTWVQWAGQHRATIGASQDQYMGSTEVRQQWTEYHRTQDIGHMREHHRAQVTGHSITGHRAGRIGRSVLIEGMLEVLVGGDDGGDGDVGGALEGTANAFKTGVKWGPRALEWGPRVGP